MKMRQNLKNARKDKDMTQQQVADYLHTDVRYYKQIESGERLGSIKMWDALEDLFFIHQRIVDLYPAQLKLRFERER